MADILELVVRYAHIASAILWIGGLGFSVMVLRSAISRVGMPARKDTLLQLIPLVNRFIPRVAISTIVFGTILYLMMGNFDPQILWGTTWGRAMLAAFGPLARPARLWNRLRATRGRTDAEAPQRRELHSRAQGRRPSDDIEPRAGHRPRLGIRHPHPHGGRDRRPVAAHPRKGKSESIYPSPWPLPTR